MKRVFAGLIISFALFSSTSLVFAQQTSPFHPYANTFPVTSTTFADKTTTTNPATNNVDYIAPGKLKQLQAEAAKGIQAQKNTTAAADQTPWNMIAAIVTILAGLAGIFGYSFASHKKKRAISKYMEEIDATFAEYKWKSKRCEAELYRLHELLVERLKKGKIDESLYDLLTKRIDKYIHEIQNISGKA